MAIPSGLTNNWLSNNSSYPGSGTTVFDAGSYNQNLTVNLTGTTYNSANRSFYFDNTANASLYSQTYGGGFTDLNNYRSAFTWHIWFKNDKPSTQATSICQMGTRASGTFTGFGLYKNTSDILGISISYGSDISSGVNVQNGWHLASITWQSGTNAYNIYIDGTLSTSGNTNFFVPAIESTDAIYYGHSPLSGYAEYFQGYIGQTALYPNVQNSTQVQDFYNSTLGVYTGPVHEYDAADLASYPGSGSTLTDIGFAVTPINLSLANATFNNVNDSFALDGTLGSYIRSANSLAGFDIGANNFSVQYWFKYDGSTAQPPYNIFLQIGSRSGSYSGFTNFILSGQFNIGKPGVADYATGFNPVIGTWYQVTMTVNSSNLVTLFINGTSVYTQTIAFVTPDNIIAMGDNGIQTDQVANASMGPLLIYNRVLSGTEITNYYNSTRSRFRVIVEYDFQNGSYSGTGNTINDLLSPQTNLTVGTGHWVAGSPNYWDLQADTNLFSDTLASAFESTTFTINCWYYPDYTTPTEYAAVWSFGSFANPGLPILSTRDNGTINIQWNFGYGITTTTVTNEWHLFTFVSNGTTTTLYVDGIFIGSNSSSSGFVATPVIIRLGSATRSGPPVDFSKGKIGFWNYYYIALNSTEVLDLYNATEGSYVGPPPPPPPYAGLVGGRLFGEGFNG